MDGHRLDKSKVRRTNKMRKGILKQVMYKRTLSICLPFANSKATQIQCVRITVGVVGTVLSFYNWFFTCR